MNVYPIICEGSVDRKLEALTQEKGDAAELVLDGHLLGEHTSEVNLAEILSVARHEFSNENTVDEAILEKQWAGLRAELTAAMKEWNGLPLNETNPPITATLEAESETMIPRHESNRGATRNTRAPHPVTVATRRSEPLWRKRICAPKIETSSLPLWRKLY